MVYRKQLVVAILLLTAALLFSQEDVRIDDSLTFEAQAILQNPCMLEEPEHQVFDGRIAILNVQVLPDSTLGNVIPVSVPGEGILDTLVIASLSDWKFSPAMKNGEPIVSEIIVNVVLLGADSSVDESVIVDTSMTIAELKEIVEENLGEMREHYLNRFRDTREVYAQENLHLYAPYQSTVYYTRNGFIQSELPISGAHALQLMKTIYPVGGVDNFYRFQVSEYRCPVALAEAQLGTGDNLMNHAYVNFRKGQFLGLDPVDINLKYMAYEGKMFEESEHTGDFLTHLTWHTSLGDIRFDNDIFNHDISSKKLEKVYQPQREEMVNERLWDHSIFWDNPWLDVGYKYQRKVYRIDNNPEDQIDDTSGYYVLHAGDSLFFQRFDITAQSRDFEHDSWMAEHHLDIYRFHTQAMFLREDGYDPLKSFRIALGDTLSVFAGYRVERDRQEYGNRFYEFTESGWFGGIGFKKRFSRLHFDLDWRFTQSEFKNIGVAEYLTNYNEKTPDVPGVDLFTRIQADISRLTILLSSKIKYRDTDEVVELPALKSSTELEFAYDVHHNNALKLGFRHLYTTDYTNWLGEEIPMTRMLDGWFGIQITKKFQINLEAYNLTGEENLFDNLARDTHYNFTLYWQFVN